MIASHSSPCEKKYHLDTGTRSTRGFRRCVRTGRHSLARFQTSCSTFYPFSSYTSLYSCLLSPHVQSPKRQVYVRLSYLNWGMVPILVKLGTLPRAGGTIIHGAKGQGVPWLDQGDTSEGSKYPIILLLFLFNCSLLICDSWFLVCKTGTVDATCQMQWGNQAFVFILPDVYNAVRIRIYFYTLLLLTVS